MLYRLKPWQWALVAVLFPCYVVWAVFQIFGGYFLGVPPWTPALLNNTKIPIVRSLMLERRSLLRITGEIREGRAEIRLDDQPGLTVVGQINRVFTLEPGTHTLRIENRESTGWVAYQVQ
jgi:hypothetical protein